MQFDAVFSGKNPKIYLTYRADFEVSGGRSWTIFNFVKFSKKFQIEIESPKFINYNSFTVYHYYIFFPLKLHFSNNVDFGRLQNSDRTAFDY